MYSLLGRDLASGMLGIELEEGPVRVSGCVTEPAVARGNRSAQFFFCNGRYIRSQLLQAAVEQAYRGTLLTGRFPACVVYIDLAPAAVDVNVHPAKTEVKFSDERRVYDAVYYAVRGALETPRRPEAAPELPEPAPEPERPAPRAEVQPMPVQPRPQPEIERRSTESGVDYAAVQCPPEPKLTFRAPAGARTGYEPPPAAPTPPPQPRAPRVTSTSAGPMDARTAAAFSTVSSPVIISASSSDTLSRSHIGTPRRKTSAASVSLSHRVER